MSLRRDLAHRSPREWTVRLGLAASAALLGYYSVAFSIAQVVAASNPALAHRLAPYDGRITAAYATSLSGEEATPQDRAQASELARRALRQDPTAVAAVATLGLNADLHGDKSTARRNFAYAQKLSRRELRTQLFMIEDAVQRGDMAAALHHYDVTLRVFPNMSELLYPVLSSASTDPAIRQELTGILAGQPLWGESFIDFVSRRSPDPKSTAALFLDLRRAGVPIPETARTGVIDTLIAAGQADAAWAYYAAIHPGADRQRLRDPRFAMPVEVPSQFDWSPINDGSGLTTGIQGGVFDFSAPASIGGPMLKQTLLLPPGIYRLTGHSMGIDQTTNALPYWTLRCQDGRELGRVDVPNSILAGGNFSGTFSIPAGCPLQDLVLIGRPSEAVSGLSGQIDRVNLMRAR